MKLSVALAALTLASFASAAPRVGQHDTYTRVVFNLPKAAAYTTKVTGNSVTVKLAATLPAEQGRLNAAGVTAYAVAGGTVTLTLAAGHGQAKTSVLAASGGQPARLIIDVPLNLAAKTIPATPKPAAVVRPTASVNPPKMARPKVVIDPGHGGVDPGMQSKWVSEEEVTLDVGLRVRDILQQNGVDVIMTRSRDTQLSTNKATDLDLRSGMAKTGEIAAYISIHVNAGNPAAEGIETYYFGKPIGGSNRSLAVLENGGGSVGLSLTRKASNAAQDMLGDILAQAKLSFSRQLATKVQYSLLSSTGAVNRGVHTDAFYVIRDPKTAAILTEIGFGGSNREGPLLATSAYRAKIASGIASAILDFLHVK